MTNHQERKKVPLLKEAEPFLVLNEYSNMSYPSESQIDYSSLCSLPLSFMEKILIYDIINSSQVKKRGI